jgi:hypothetical protein
MKTGIIKGLMLLVFYFIGTHCLYAFLNSSSQHLKDGNAGDSSAVIIMQSGSYFFPGDIV